MLVELADLHIGFRGPAGVVEAVRGVSFTLGRERLGIVGESGSGKSLTARAILRLLPGNAVLRAERIAFDGIDVLHASERDMRRIRGARAGLILQDPKFALNPVMTAGAQIAESFMLHRRMSRRQARAATLDTLAQLRIGDPARVAGAYPHTLSGGMGQRVMIAMMLAPDPELLIADEPTSALDASVQEEILRLIQEQVDARKMGLILISHDLPMVSRVCDRVLVMNAGRVVEEVRADRLMQAEHPYTRGLLQCVPSLAHPVARLPMMRRDAV